jgi:hypothetical protein
MSETLFERQRALNKEAVSKAGSAAVGFVLGVVGFGIGAIGEGYAMNAKELVPAVVSLLPFGLSALAFRYAGENTVDAVTSYQQAGAAAHLGMAQTVEITVTQRHPMEDSGPVA